MPIFLCSEAGDIENLGWLPPSEIDAFVELAKKYHISGMDDEYRFLSAMVMGGSDGLEFWIEAEPLSA